MIGGTSHLFSKFVINLGLLLIGSAMAFSGLLTQFKYHMGHQGEIDTSYLVLGINYSGWSNIHRVAIVIVSILVAFHIVLDWKWYETVVRKRLLGRHKQVVTLIVLFVIVAVTGYVPWFTEITGGSELTRKAFIEIHDKLVFVLLVYLVLHVIRRFKWFVTTFDRLKK
jgi:hypothetical protein